MRLNRAFPLFQRGPLVWPRELRRSRDSKQVSKATRDSLNTFVDMRAGFKGRQLLADLLGEQQRVIAMFASASNLDVESWRQRPMREVRVEVQVMDPLRNRRRLTDKEYCQRSLIGAGQIL